MRDVAYRSVGSGEWGQPGVGVWTGTWNVSYWSRDRLATIAPLKVDLIALQETKVAAHYIKNVRAA